MNSRFRAVGVVLLVWALIYLPALGSIAIKGEEGRRSLPAVRMLETGNYIVPRIGSNPYSRKPPLVNWLVAASFAVSSVRNEWTARLTSALAVLAVAIAFVTMARASIVPTGSLIAALIRMTNIGMIEKGRLIEIEALYVSTCGLVTIFWLICWVQMKSPWLFLFPFARFSKFHDESHRQLARALAWGIAVPFVAVNLVPGSVARYSMPVIVPASWLLGMIYAGNALQWPRAWTKNDRGWL